MLKRFGRFLSGKSGLVALAALVCGVMALALRTPGSIDVPRLPLDRHEIAVIQVKPLRVLENPYLWSSRIDQFVPSHLSPAQLAALGVELLTIRTQLTDDGQLDNFRLHSGLQWSAVAKLKQSISIEELCERWRTATVAHGPAIVPEVTQTEGQITVVRVPAGTFLAPTVRTGTLHFENASGKRLERGVNVGKIDPYYQFVEGGSGNNAVFRFTGISADELSTGRLDFRLKCSRFNTGTFSDEPLRLHVQLRNRLTQAVSASVTVETLPMQEFHFTFPDVTSSTSTHGNEPGPAIKLSDFLDSGQVDVLLSHDRPGLYLGVGQGSLCIDQHQYEYFTLINNSLFAAQSIDSLQQLVAGHDDSAEELYPADLHCSLSLDSPKKRYALSRWPLINEFSSSLIDDCMALDLQVDFLPSIRAQARLETSQRFRSLRGGEFRPTLGLAWLSCRARARESMGVLETTTRLVKYAAEGVLPDFPSQSRLSPARMFELTERFTGEPDAGPQVNSRQHTEVIFTQPPCHFKDAPETNGFLANMQFALASNVFEYHHYELGIYGLEHSLSYLPHDPMLRFRVAHQLAYNTAVDFRSPLAYRWIRRGLTVLLDGIEAKPALSDNYWSAARLLYHKVTEDDIAPHFAKDAELQSRLHRLAGSGHVSTEVWSDGWLAAAQLLNRALEVQSGSKILHSIPPIIIRADLVRAQAGYAKSLAIHGNIDQSQMAWQAVGQLCEQLANERIISIDSKLYCLADLDAAGQRQPIDAGLVQQLEFEWLRSQLELHTTCARVQQTSQMRQADQSFLEARRALEERDTALALAIFESTFQQLAIEFTDARELVAVVHCVRPERQLFSSLSTEPHAQPPRSPALRRWRDAVHQASEEFSERARRLVDGN